MSKRTEKRRPSRSESEQVRYWMDSFLLKMMTAAQKASKSSRAGYSLTGEDRYLSEMAYHKNCEACLKWLLSHTQSFCRSQLVYKEDAGNGGVVSTDRGGIAEQS